MIKLSAEYTTNMDFTPQINNSATGGTYNNERANTLYIQIRASGFYLMRQRLIKNHTLAIDLKDKTQIPEAGQNELIKLPTSSIRDKISDILGQNIGIISIEPDTLYLRYSKPNRKKVPVVQNFTLSFEKEYRQTAAIQFEPDSIIITGPSEMLDTINEIPTVNNSYLNLNNRLETNLSLKEINNVVYSQNKVKLTIPIERCTESIVKMPISILNSPDDYSILLLPPQVEVKYVVPLKDYPSVNVDGFHIAVDYQQADSLLVNSKLRVKVYEKPEQVISVQISPEFVDYIQHKK